MSHTLILKSDSTEIDDSVRYSFHHGCCTVRVIPLPRIEGRFSFLAAHSRYPNLNMTITVVLVEKAPEIVYDSRQPQLTDEDIFFLENSSDLKNPKVEIDNRSIVLVKSPDSTKDIGNIVGNLFNKQKELKDKVLEYATYIGEHENKHETLRTQRLEFEKALSKMQASLDAISSVESSFSPEKERIVEEIELMGHTAASVALASECGISLDGRYSVLCLEDTRPYDGDYNRGDPQRMLLLPNPTLPNGNSPPGFIGYAVNMIYLDANHLYTRTSGGSRS
ncbi:hypothetical protein POM88_007446 [Heracleum sosnowskyi]|uniref:Uncharacterized protein n=1 Tax=Heracleum sosnowskyi TaxID=360622 RepID=A0AAD8J5F3_9APIA|nr:hypothetical protein POM88_007446 [Heracleum sosnowskyi]